MYRLFILLIIATTTTFVHCDDEKYPSTFDHIDAKAILENEQIREQYMNCFLDKGPCVTPDQIFTKEYLPEIVATQCGKCTDKQKEAFDLINGWYAENRPDEYQQFIEYFIKKAQEQ